MRSTPLFLIVGLLLLIGGGLVSAESLPVSATTAATADTTAAVLLVDNDGDSGTYLPGATCIAGIPNDCSLRQAIITANDTNASDTIRFDTSAYPDGMVISPRTALPEITKPVIINGVANNPGTCPTDLLPAELTVTIDGSQVEEITGALSTYAFLVESQDSTIKGLSIVNFPGTAIILEGDSIDVVCNHLGLTPDGEEGGNFAGVKLQDGANQVVGGSLPEDRNVISDNVYGVYVDETQFVGRLIIGNYIGLDEHGVSGMGNLVYGIYHEHDSVMIEDNVISANLGGGITSAFGSTTEVTIEGNVIGLSALANIELGNLGTGIDVRAENSIIIDNVVSANADYGIYAINAPEIRGNYVGTTRDGQSAAGNTGIGIYATGPAIIDDNVVSDNRSGLKLIGDNMVVTNNRVGTTADGNSPLGNTTVGIEYFGDGSQFGGGPSERNIIGSNRFGFSMNGSSNNTVEGNYIGVGADGTTDLGNSFMGIGILGESNNNQIGTLSNPNLILNNSHGLQLSEVSSGFPQGTGNTWRHNIFEGNIGLGIDLKPWFEEYGGVTPNDPDDADSGPNGLQNFMELISAESTGRLVGVLEGNNGPYFIDIYQADGCNASGYGEGGSNLINTYIRSTTGGELIFDEVLSTVPPLGSYLLTLVTDADGNSSEFSNCVQVVEGAFSVDSTADFGDNNPGDGDCESVGPGVCTLRAAIEEVNALGGGPYTISFDFGLLALTRVIDPSSPLPALTTPVIIDASTVANTSCPTGSSAASYGLILDGTNTSGNGLELDAGASGSTVRGLHIRNFSGHGIQVDGDDNVIACNQLENNDHGINVNGDDNRIGGTARSERNVMINNGRFGIRLGNSATRNKVQGNYIGVAGDGTTGAGNGDSGVFLSGGGTNRIGGSVGFAANVIADNGEHGIEIDAGDGGNQIWGNLIGLDAAGSSALGNAESGIYVNNANSNDIGGDSDEKGNVIAANGRNGIYLNSSSNFVQRNTIGTDATGLVDLGNGSMGIRVIDGDTNLIGGEDEAAGNLISGNDDSGIYVAGSAVGTTIRYNEIGVSSGGNPLGNRLNGVHLAGQVSQAVVQDNTIAHNGLDGIAVFETVILSNFAANEIVDNGGLGIDLNNDDVVNPNDSNDGDGGANGLMNFPVILDANADVNSVTILLNSLAPRTYRIHVYRNRSCDSSGHGEGERYLGSFDVETVAGNNFVQDTGFLAFNFNAGDQISATATPLTSPITDGTSEFSACFTATGFVEPDPTWGEQNVGFVINTTAGMQPAIDRVHDAWIQTPWTSPTRFTPETLHLVPFKDSAIYLGGTDYPVLFGDWIDDLQAAGGAGCADDIFDGLRTFGVNLDEDSAPVSDAIVFSDAPPAGNRRAFGYILDQLTGRGVRAHNVGPTQCSSGNLSDAAMHYLALLSGGTIHTPHSLDEYPTDVQMALNRVLAQDLVGRFAGTLNNSVASFPLEIDSTVTTLGVDVQIACLTCTTSLGAPFADILLTAPDITVELLDPDGNVVDATTSGFQQFGSSTRQQQLLFETLTVGDSGTWQLRVSGDGPYAVNVFAKSELHMTSIGSHAVQVDDVFQVGAFIAPEEHASCSSCRPVDVALTLVGLDNAETVPVTLSAAGANPAVYRGTVSLSTPGLYLLMAEGELEDGSQFMRVDPAPIRVREHSMSGSGSGSAVAGSTRTITFELVNAGAPGRAATTTFDLELFSELGWTAGDALPASVTLAPGESVVYTVATVIPASADSGQVEESVLVAVPQDDLSAAISLRVETTVVDLQYVYLPTITR